jgi:5'-nucleotidase
LPSRAKGFRGTRQHGVEPQVSPSGRRFIWVKGGAQDIRTGPARMWRPTSTA